MLRMEYRENFLQLLCEQTLYNIGPQNIVILINIVIYIVICYINY